MKKVGRKKQLIYGVVLGAALIALAIDRMLGGPAEANAESTAAVGLVTTAGKKPTTPPAKGPAIARVFEHEPAQSPESLNSPKTTDLRDAFGLTAGMQRLYDEHAPQIQSGQTASTENQQDLRQREAEQFIAAHKLKGTSLQNGTTWALIDDRLIQVGEQIDGFELQRVEDYRAELKKGSIVVTLTLPLPF